MEDVLVSQQRMSGKVLGLQQPMHGEVLGSSSSWLGGGWSGKKKALSS